MSPSPDIVDRDQQMLAELAELDLALARHVQARALATDDAAAVADLSRAYQRISRSVRQTLALKAKLKRDAEQHARWLDARDVRPAMPASAFVDRAARRRGELEAAVARVIWAEREFDKPDWEDRLDQRLRNLETFLDKRSRTDGFGRGALDEDVLTLSADLGLSRRNALIWRDLPDLDLEEDEADENQDEDGEDDEPPARRASG